MPKAIEDFISGETYRAIKRLSLPDMNSYLYSLYSAGYTAGLRDGAGERFGAAIDQISVAVKKLTRKDET